MQRYGEFLNQQNISDVFFDLFFSFRIRKFVILLVFSAFAFLCFSSHECAFFKNKVVCLQFYHFSCSFADVKVKGTMQEKTAAIVLHCLKYNDTSHIVNVYTESQGRCAYIIKVSRARKSGVRSSLFHPLALVELEAEGRNTAQLRRITEARPS